MASPNTTFTAGAILTAAQMNDLPFGLVGAAENTSLAQTFTTIVDLTSLSVTFTGIAGRRYRVEGYLLMQSNTNGDAVNLQIRDGSNTVLQQGIYHLESSAVAYMATACTVIAATGSTTVKLSGLRQAGTGTITANGGSTFPAQIIVTDIGSI